MFWNDNETVMISYDPGDDGNYISETNRKIAGLPILWHLTKRVRVANGSTSSGTFVTKLHFLKLSAQAVETDTFQEFPTSLMSVGKTANDGKISIFTKTASQCTKNKMCWSHAKTPPSSLENTMSKDAIAIYWSNNEDNGNRANQPKKSKKYLREANSVYNLTSTEQAIKWMHAVCGYPVKSTWLKAIKAGNFVSLPLPNKWNVMKYYPETTEPPKGHESNKEEREVHRAKTNWTWSLWYHNLTRQENAWRVHQGLWCLKRQLFQSDRAVPKTIPTRQHVHHGDGRDWYQSHPCQASQQPKRCWINISPSHTNPSPQTSWYCPKVTCPW